MDPLIFRFVKHGCICFDVDDVVVYVDPYMVPMPRTMRTSSSSPTPTRPFSPDDIAKGEKGRHLLCLHA